MLIDDARDLLTGSQGLDWFFARFFANIDLDDDGRRDRITDLKAGEFADDLDWIEGIDDIVAPGA